MERNKELETLEARLTWLTAQATLAAQTVAAELKAGRVLTAHAASDRLAKTMPELVEQFARTSQAHAHAASRIVNAAELQA